jgi:hypothetical protein
MAGSVGTSGRRAEREAEILAKGISPGTIAGEEISDRV